MKVKAVAALTGVTVRTLHHYDDIGLLKPAIVTDAGYRLYSDDNISTLQQILFFRELGFPLKRIQQILQDPTFNRLEALELQLDMLRAKRKQLDIMMETIQQTIKSEKEGMTMTNEEKFQGFKFSMNPYEEEARKRWGDQAVDDTNKTVQQFGKQIEKQMNEVYFELAELRHTDPTSAVAQEAIQKWYLLLNKMGTYSLDAFAGLGEMYIADERFTKSIDQFGEGLAQFMRDAMQEFAKQRK